MIPRKRDRHNHFFLSIAKRLKLLTKVMEHDHSSLFSVTASLTIWIMTSQISQGAPPVMLVTTGGKQEIVHDGSTEPQRFPPHKWILIAPQSSFGASVTWECDGFRNVTDTKLEADVQLELQLSHSDRRSGWAPRVSLDRTHVSSGDRHALVVAESSREGNAQVDLLVTLLEPENSLLAAGDYEAVVVATITEN